MAFFVKFWGARGSIPTPSRWMRVYGGNTSCVEVRCGDTQFICDAGSGIRELGKDLLARPNPPRDLHLLITHTHWDHIQGFPFFTPAYVRSNRIFVYGESAEVNSPYRLLSGQMSSDYFPVSFKDLGASIIPEHLDQGCKEINGVRVRGFPLHHPGGCTGYRLEKDGCKIIYATDNELVVHPEDVSPAPNYAVPPRRLPPELVEIVRDADLLITDAQYDEKEYAAKRGWGHSSCLSATDLGLQAGVKNLALFHHDPECTDAMLEQRVALCRSRVAARGSSMRVFAAREGVELKF